jgi:nicotinamidase/pyrazinamidase
MKVHVLIIDPQNSFMSYPESELPVPGATEDMVRVAGMIGRIGHKIDDIHVTMDSHRLLDIAHTGMQIGGSMSKSWWTNDKGENPPPYGLITASDVRSRAWYPRVPNFYQRSLEYVEALEAKGNYVLCTWPPHCIIGTWGHNIQVDLNNALQRWSSQEFATVNYVTKGSNIWTEHYGGLEAEVPDPEDPTTMLNTKFIAMIAEADMVAVAGEALSHCVRATVTQIADNIGDEHIRKFHILTDGSTAVPAIPGVDFPALAQLWLGDMVARGMKLSTTKEFLS